MLKEKHLWKKSYKNMTFDFFGDIYQYTEINLYYSDFLYYICRTITNKNYGATIISRN